MGLMGRMYRVQHNGAFMPRVNAPSRYTLKAFGGRLTIDEFRSESLDTTTVNMPGHVFTPQQVVSVTQNYMNTRTDKEGHTNSDKNELHTQLLRSTRSEKQRVVQHSKERTKMSRINASSTLQNETLKLKRTKPLAHRIGNLESMMGIRREKMNVK